jgi:hypothetical protein
MATGPNQADVEADSFVFLDHDPKLEAFRFSFGHRSQLAHLH